MSDQTEASNDLEQLVGILAQFDPSTIEQAFRLMTDGAPCHLAVGDTDDPGVETGVGEDGRVTLDEIPLLERMIGVNNLLPAHFLEEGAIVQRAVARVALTESHGGLPAGAGWGTGFLVAPTIFITNNHVVPSEGFANKVRVEFNYQLDHHGNPQIPDSFTTDPSDLFYTNAPLDFTLVRLSPKRREVPALSGTLGVHPGRWEQGEGIGGHVPTDLPYRTLLGPATPAPSISCGLRDPGEKWGRFHLPGKSVKYATGQHVNIIQHPKGRRKEIGLRDNHIDKILGNHIRYTTDTEPGSSGSPVCNNSWDLVAIHHAGGERKGGVWVNNQGVRMDKIVADIRGHFGVSPSGKAVLQELGV